LLIATQKPEKSIFLPLKNTQELLFLNLTQAQSDITLQIFYIPFRNLVFGQRTHLLVIFRNYRVTSG
jgi:hypothetical protein